MKYIKNILLGLLFIIAFFPSVFAENTSIYEKAVVTELADTQEGKIIKALYPPNSSEGKIITIELGSNFYESESEKILKKGDAIVIEIIKNEDNTYQYFYAERYRFSRIVFVFLVFVIFALILTRGKGLKALIGLLVTIAFIVFLIVPLVANGKSTFFVGALSLPLMAISSILISHGFKKTTLIALLSTLITLILSVAFAFFAVEICFLFGMGSESAFYAQMGVFSELNFQGILFLGILIGALGVLDDVTTTQTTAIYELKKANNNLGTKELIKSGFKIGNEHIFSLINTLALAYAGASLPLLLLFSADQLPWWLVLNSEAISEEVIRTLVGSTSLLFAVPISTFLASLFFGKNKKD